MCEHGLPRVVLFSFRLTLRYPTIFVRPLPFISAIQGEGVRDKPLKMVVERLSKFNEARKKFRVSVMTGIDFLMAVMRVLMCYLSCAVCSLDDIEVSYLHCFAFRLFMNHATSY